MSDIGLYYSNTVNFVDGKLCNIGNSYRGGVVYRPLKGGKSSIVADISKLKPINDVQVGFVNTPMGAVYLNRISARTAKEGINNNNTFCPDGPSRNLIWEEYPYEFEDMINNVYPTMDEAIEMARENGISVAFSKHECIDTRGRVYNALLNKVNFKRIKRYVVR